MRSSPHREFNLKAIFLERKKKHFLEYTLRECTLLKKENFLTVPKASSPPVPGRHSIISQYLDLSKF